ncbi:MAG: hypothetical protein WBI18_06790 [Candidatus Saccharicenans sp.]
MNRKTLRMVLRLNLTLPGGKKEYQAFVERSPQSDDNEFDLPQIERSADLKEFYFRALRWQFMYNTRRYHSTPGMTPQRKLRTQMKISKQVALFPVIQLEKLTDLHQKLCPLPGYHVSACDRNPQIQLLILQVVGCWRNGRKLS